MTRPLGTIVGALACQKDSFLKELETSVVGCTEHKGHITAKDKQNKGKKDKSGSKSAVQYAVELQDTVLFPEGGGQPFDTGYMATKEDTIAVHEVFRDKLTALHLTSKPVEPGTTVNLSIDWERRFDHMQQHTGQHLVSAIFDTYNLETLSWASGELMNYVELPQTVDPETVKEVGEKINKVILDDLPIRVEAYDGSGNGIDTSHLPDDYDTSQGIVRIVRIGDLDRNPCCGTHLASTSQIQTISFFHQTKVRGGHSRLYFTCGSRVFRYLTHLYNIMKSTSGDILSCQVDEVYDKVKALESTSRNSYIREQNLLKELANIEASRVYNRLKTLDTGIDFVYKSDNSPDYITAFQKELLTMVNNDKDLGIDFDKTHTVVMINGNLATGGMIKIFGPKAFELQPELKQRLTNLKGGGKGTTFQGKVSKYEKGEIDNVIEYLDSLKI